MMGLSAPRVIGLGRSAHGSIMCSAAIRSAWPLASVRQASRTRPLRFSINAWPIEQSLASLPGPLRWSRALRIVVEACVSLERFWPWKSASRFRPPPAVGGSPEPSFGRKLFIDAQALDPRAVDREMVRAEQTLHPRLRHCCAQELGGNVASRSRSRFFENVE